MPSREELESHPVTTLKKEISKTNIKGYSKMKKPEIVELMLKNKDRFHHIKMAEKKPKEEMIDIEELKSEIIPTARIMSLNPKMDISEKGVLRISIADEKISQIPETIICFISYSINNFF